MISVVIGGGATEKTTFQKFRQELGGISNVIRATDEDAFLEFCRQALRSTEMLKIKVGHTDKYVEKRANDDIIVFFPEEYLQGLDIPFMYKLATVIETAIDMHLNIQAFSFVGEKVWNKHDLDWPPHWPTVKYFSAETQGNND
jgi:hypothetical protein